MSGDRWGEVFQLLQELRGGQAKLESGQAKLESGQAKLEVGQVALRTELISVRTDVMARIDRVQDAVTGLRTEMTARFDLIRDDIDVSMGRAESVHQIADHTRSELRALSEVVTGMGKQIRNLQNEVGQLRDRPPA